MALLQGIRVVPATQNIEDLLKIGTPWHHNSQNTKKTYMFCKFSVSSVTKKAIKAQDSKTSPAPSWPGSLAADA